MSELGGPFHNFWTWTQKWIQKFCNLWKGPFHNFWSWHSEMNFNFFPSSGEGPFHSIWSWTQKWKFGIDMFPTLGCPPISSTLQTFEIWIFNTENSNSKFFQWFSADGKKVHSTTLHASLNCTCKSRILKYFHQMSELEESIPKLLTLNSEIKVWHWYLLWGFLQYQVHYRHFKSAFSIQKIVN